MTDALSSLAPRAHTRSRFSQVSNVQKRMEFIKQEEERCVKRQQELQGEAAKIMGA